MRRREKEEKPKRKIRTKGKKRKKKMAGRVEDVGKGSGLHWEINLHQNCGVGLTFSLPLVGLAFLLDTTSFSTTPKKRCSDCVWKDTVPLGSFLMRTAWFL